MSNFRCALEGAGAVRLRHALEVAERLKQGDIKSVVGSQCLYLARGGVIGQEIVFENLHAGKAGLGDRRQLFGNSPLIDTVAMDVRIGMPCPAVS